MATKIIPTPTEFKPVKIEIEFTTPEQLAMFVQVMGVPAVIAEAIQAIKDTNLLVHPKLSSYTDEYYDLIDGLIDFDTWFDLKHRIPE